ncbi:unnamed protein product [Ophioblennius macclurei]
MSDILTLVFRTFTSQTGVNEEATSPGACTSTISSSSVLVVGDGGASRSVLLLAAVTAASETGIKVVYFTHKQIQSLPVCLQRCVPNLSPDSLKKIKFCYPRTLEELLLQVASLHESANATPTPPSLIIVDRLESFLRGSGSGTERGSHPGEESCSAHVAALLHDTAAFLTGVLEGRGSGPCRLIASYLLEDQDATATAATDPVLDVLDRYFQVRCTLDRDRGYEAAAAGAQEAWHVYLSGRGVAGDGDEDRMGVVQEWRLFTSADGLMEFKLA